MGDYSKIRWIRLFTKSHKTIGAVFDAVAHPLELRKIGQCFNRACANQLAEKSGGEPHEHPAVVRERPRID